MSNIACLFNMLAYLYTAVYYMVISTICWLILLENEIRNPDIPKLSCLSSGMLVALYGLACVLIYYGSRKHSGG